jgi:hypothetical protein
MLWLTTYHYIDDDTDDAHQMTWLCIQKLCMTHPGRPLGEPLGRFDGVVGEALVGQREAEGRVEPRGHGRVLRRHLRARCTRHEIRDRQYQYLVTRDQYEKVAFSPVAMDGSCVAICDPAAQCMKHVVFVLGGGVVPSRCWWPLMTHSK